MSRMSVWVVQYVDHVSGTPGYVACVYANKAAAEEHVNLHNRGFLDGVFDRMVMFEHWGVSNQRVVVFKDYE